MAVFHEKYIKDVLGSCIIIIAFPDLEIAAPSELLLLLLF